MDPPVECGKLRSGGQYGPFDYRKQNADQRALVEDHHFHIEYQAFLLGKDDARTHAGLTPVASGFDYTLRAFPNQPLALSAMDRLSLRQRRDPPTGARWPVRCYFERAIAFAPDDPLVRALYALHLARRGESEAMEAQAQLAVSGAPEDANTLIQVAAAYFALQQYPKAQTYAQRAYDLGYPVYGLRDRMIQLGHWDTTAPPVSRKEDPK